MKNKAAWYRTEQLHESDEGRILSRLVVGPELVVRDRPTGLHDDTDQVVEVR
jgi:hypothetical protein